MSLRDDLFVESNQSVDSSFSDLQRGKVREKIITNKETHEHPVIYGSLEGGRGGEREREREREGRTEKYEYSYVACGAINLPPSQMEKADHQCEALAPNTAI